MQYQFTKCNCRGAVQLEIMYLRSNDDFTEVQFSIK
uniref:Uncharacterized protein n=1 Tax=Siphoviridae sp. cttG313 TaxID=2825704 RepID=A0A8S5TSA4_9CAUD|nr:MAG TPA: hypothetical protein [Siphoviridae sp. cttG313]DAS56269.1 MAG TPA: hypothetical protein [Caudoviricetes sp.]